MSSPYPEPDPSRPIPPGIYNADGDEWTYEVRDDGSIRTKKDAEEWRDVLPGEQPEVHAAIMSQLEGGTLQSALRYPQDPKSRRLLAAQRAIRKHQE